MLVKAQFPVSSYTKSKYYTGEESERKSPNVTFVIVTTNI